MEPRNATEALCDSVVCLFHEPLARNVARCLSSTRGVPDHFIAQRLGISARMVRRQLNALERDGVVERAACGWKVATGLAQVAGARAARLRQKLEPRLCAACNALHTAWIECPHAGDELMGAFERDVAHAHQAAATIERAAQRASECDGDGSKSA